MSVIDDHIPSGAYPWERAAWARARALELHDRRLQLVAGNATAESEELARERCAQADLRAAAAWQAALDAHVEAARAHRRAAAAHEQAALTLDETLFAFQQRAAERHRSAADLHEAKVARMRAASRSVGG